VVIVDVIVVTVTAVVVLRRMSSSIDTQTVLGTAFLVIREIWEYIIEDIISIMFSRQFRAG
jgi:hypothetical protein